MNVIKKFRGESNLTQGEFARQCGVSRYFVALNENQEYPTVEKIDIAYKMSALMNVSIFEFYGMGIFKVAPKTKEDYDYLIDLLKSEKSKKYGD